MADATVALDFSQTLDVQRHVAAKIAFHADIVLVDVVTDLGFI